MKIRFYPVREVGYYEESITGIYGCMPELYDDYQNIKFNKYGNFTLKGVMPRLELDKIYEAKVELGFDKYGAYYENKYLYEPLPMTTTAEKNYLSSILTSNQVYEIYKVYPSGGIIKMIQNNTFDYTKVKGLGESSYERIKNKILNNLGYQQALEELSERFKLNYQQIIRLCEEFKSPQLLVEAVKDNPYVLADEVKGIGFKTADKYALRDGIEKDSPLRIEACIKHILSEAGNDGHSWLPITDVLEQSKELLGIAQSKIYEVIEVFRGIYNSDKLREDYCQFYVDDERIGFYWNYNYENEMAIHLQKLISAEPVVKINDIDKRIDEAEKSLSISLDAMQRKAAKIALQENVFLLDGAGGTGKSYLLKFIFHILSDYPYIAGAFSGKPAVVLKRLGLDAGTIHSRLEYNPQNGFMRNKDNPLDVAVVYIDETGTIPSYLGYQLITAIRPGTKVIFFGDLKQLEPIGAGYIFRDMIESNRIPHITLDKIHRQAEKSGILQVATTIRNGKQLTGKNEYTTKVYGELKDQIVKTFSSAKEVYDNIIKACKTYDGDILEFQVIVPMNKRGILSTSNLNKELQKIFNPGEKPSVYANGFQFKEDDKVIHRGNNKNKGLSNGTLGIIKKIDVKLKKFYIQFIGDDEVKEFTKNEMIKIDPAYALTVHLNIGSQYENVIAAYDMSAYKLLCRESVYTAVTRASKKGLLLAENKALRFAISRSNAPKRNTFLCELLQKYIPKDDANV